MQKASSRPQVTIYNHLTGDSLKQCKLPEVFLSPLRPDLIQFVHTNMAKNKRQPYGVKVQTNPTGIVAGHQHSAHSWGTGRAVSRIPRVSGSGTNRVGQGAIGNMCRDGHMFASNKVIRKWNRKINKNQRRFATVSALAATAIPSLVQARGHKIENVPEIPLVIDSQVESLKKTTEAITTLNKIGAYSDISKVIGSKKIRPGKGKRRNRRHVMKKGPLVIYNKDDGIVKAFRNLPGLELCQVDKLNLLQLAPGAHVGRFIIWTESAFRRLSEIFGTFKKESKIKNKYVLPTCPISNTDINRIILSEEIQSVLRPKKEKKLPHNKRGNPLRNIEEMIKLNPYVKVKREGIDE